MSANMNANHVNANITDSGNGVARHECNSLLAQMQQLKQREAFLCKKQESSFCDVKVHMKGNFNKIIDNARRFGYVITGSFSRQSE